jgi:hypothetical protein
VISIADRESNVSKKKVLELEIIVAAMTEKLAINE